MSDERYRRLKEILEDHKRRLQRNLTVRLNEVRAHNHDGKVVEGAILFNETKGCGKVINVDREISVDFNLEQIAAVHV